VHINGKAPDGLPLEQHKALYYLSQINNLKKFIDGIFK